MYKTCRSLGLPGTHWAPPTHEGLYRANGCWERKRHFLPWGRLWQGVHIPVNNHSSMLLKTNLRKLTGSNTHTKGKERKRSSGRGGVTEERVVGLIMIKRHCMPIWKCQNEIHYVQLTYTNKNWKVLKIVGSLVWCVLRRLRQKDCKFEASLHEKWWKKREKWWFKENGQFTRKKCKLSK